ncbi:MAG: NAD(P)-dependent alcohol dehydrogenase [Cyclobacteriaceae bacterium]|nr:NAD(P)-dependent alcohol dehydrogenase [Cyclobacteriaceae bacterium]MDH5249528.1 NAD(P)-dependent alcohol dehydrogenase [Cyclobacteriaceae bacterium]
MKAAVYTKYGLTDVLELKDLEKPVPGDNEALVSVHAVSINDWDWGLLRGEPFMNRMISGFLKPKIRILGSDIAGKIEAVGKYIKQFQVGDEVFGDLSGCGWGGFAEYVCAPESALALKPKRITFEAAAAIPQAGLLALQGLRDKMQIQPGQKVLINGAGGGAGSFAVQIAKSFGAEVTGVDSTEKLDLMHAIGADHTIDYTKEDFTKTSDRYDMILDFAAHRSIFNSRRALCPRGTYVMVGGSTPRIFQLMLLGPLISMMGSKKMSILRHKPNKDLNFMKALIAAGKVVPIIDKIYRLSEVPEALKYFGEGHAKGKVVITLEYNNPTM